LPEVYIVFGQVVVIPFFGSLGWGKEHDYGAGDVFGWCGGHIGGEGFIWFIEVIFVQVPYMGEGVGCFVQGGVEAMFGQVDMGEESPVGVWCA